MKYIGLATLALVLLSTVPSMLYAKGAGIEWEILNQEALDLRRSGKYERAVLLAEDALLVAEQNVGANHPDVATSLNNLAALYYDQGYYAKSESLDKRSLLIAEQALGADHPNVASALENLAALYRETNRGAVAEALEQRAAKMRAIKR